MTPLEYAALFVGNAFLTALIIVLNDRFFKRPSEKLVNKVEQEIRKRLLNGVKTR